MTKTTWTKKGLILVAALTVINMMMVSYVFLGFKELSAQNTATAEAQQKRDAEIQRQLATLMEKKDSYQTAVAAVTPAPKEEELTTRHSSRRFTKTFKEGRPWAEVKKDDFGSRRRDVPIREHKGGKVLAEDDMRASIKAVINRMPNLRYTKELEELMFETVAAETNVGELKFSTTAKSRNYGIAQLRLDNTKEMLAWIKDLRPDVYREIEALRNTNHDLCWNITYNVPFSLAMMTQFYWRRAPDLYAHIGTRTKRAELWKAAYNTYLGAGTVSYYIKRAKEYDS